MWTKILGWVTGGAAPWLFAGAMAAAFAAGAWGGGKVAAVRAESGFTDERKGYAATISDLTAANTVLTQDNADLRVAVEKQNSAVAVAEAQTAASDAAKAQAQKHADDMAAFSKSRMDKLAGIIKTATSCDAVLRQSWEVRK